MRESYPVAIIEDRYGGAYSRGKWLAVAFADLDYDGETRASFVLTNGPSGSDGEAMCFWLDPPDWIAVGDCPDDALAALQQGEGDA